MCAVLTVLGCVAIYLIPWLIALSRKHTNSSGILALNFFLGWTGYFWVLALIWAVWNHAPRYHVHRHYRG
ncbi:MAG: superinfection immunity protein [Gemmataceae bacterium]|nr:superinfection immunity protein [Gemmataceae bacterium]